MEGITIETLEELAGVCKPSERTQAWKRLVVHYFPLLKGVAEKTLWPFREAHCLQLSDFMQWGTIGLLAFAENFALEKVDRGYKHPSRQRKPRRRNTRERQCLASSYAAWHIRKAIIHGFIKMLGGGVTEDALARRLPRLRTARHRLEQKMSRSPSPEELAGALGISVATVQRHIAEEQALLARVGLSTAEPEEEQGGTSSSSILNLETFAASKHTPARAIVLAPEEPEQAWRQQIFEKLRDAILARLEPCEQIILEHSWLDTPNRAISREIYEETGEKISPTYVAGRKHALRTRLRQEELQNVCEQLIKQTPESRLILRELYEKASPHKQRSSRRKTAND